MLHVLQNGPPFFGQRLGMGRRYRWLGGFHFAGTDGALMKCGSFLAGVPKCYLSILKWTISKKLLENGVVRGQSPLIDFIFPQFQRQAVESLAHLTRERLCAIP